MAFWLRPAALSAAVCCAVLVVVMLDRSSSVTSTHVDHLRSAADHLASSAPSATPDGAALETHLHAVRETVATMVLVAHDLDAERAHKRWLCGVSDPERLALAEQVARVNGVTRRSIETLRILTARRIAMLQQTNDRLAWRGWRGSREHELNRLYALAHDIAVVQAAEEIGLDRLQRASRALAGDVPYCT